MDISGNKNRVTERSIVSTAYKYGESMSTRRFVNGLFFALWVAVCAASPEFIWQGLLSVRMHFSPRDAVAALLIGAILAFFVEPILERIRGLGKHSSLHKTPAFATCEALAFAFVAVCMHEAITGYVAAGHAHTQANENLVRALTQVVEWAAIPFLVTIAWIAARGPRWLAWPIAGAAVIASYASGVALGWTLRELLTTLIPSMLILIAGCEQWKAATFRRCARITAIIALVWLVATGTLQTVLSLTRVTSFQIYDMTNFFVDMRFYIGWVMGLVVAPALVDAPRRPAPDEA
jgi:hypothetical protein